MNILKREYSGSAFNGLSYTLKIHVIQDHLADRLSKTGMTLKRESDEINEQVHHRKMGVNCHKAGQQNIICHWNSLNLIIFN